MQCGCLVQPSRFLQHPPLWLLLPATTVRVLLIYVEHNGRSQTDGRHDGPVSCAVFVRHDALARLILIDQDMVRASMRTGGEDMTAAFVFSSCGC